MKTTPRATLTVAVLLGLLATTAGAAVTTYTSLSAFNTATTGNVAYNFEGIAPATLYVGGNRTVGGVSFSAPQGILVFDAGAVNGSGTYANYGASFLDAQGAAPLVLNVSLSGATAIAFYYGSYAQNNIPVAAALSTGDLFNLASTPTPQGVATNFIGFASDSANITSIAFSTAGFNSSAVLNLTGFIVGSKGVQNPKVPLPSTLVLMSLAGLLLAKKHLKASASAQCASNADAATV